MGWTGWHGPREEGLIRHDIMLAYLQQTPRSIWEITEERRERLAGQRMQTNNRITASAHPLISWHPLQQVWEKVRRRLAEQRKVLC